MKALIFCLSLFLVFIYLLGCQSNKPKEQPQENNSTPLATDTSRIKVKSTDNSSETKTVYYNVPSPLEMSSILKRSNTDFRSELLNPLGDIERFATEANIALNLGIYGVDFGYCKLLDQTQEAIKYLNVVRKLSKKLGIPNDRTKLAFELLEENKKGQEVLLNVISETYLTTDLYLKENKRETTASLIFLGGWIEGLYIATNIYKRDGNNGAILNRIAEQKFSLNTLIGFLSRYQNDLTVDKYFSKLLLLRKIYEKIELNYKQSGLKIDTSKKVITLKNESEVSITKSQIADITRIVENIRKSIVE